MIDYDEEIKRYERIKDNIYNKVLNGEISYELGSEWLIELVYSITDDDFMRYFIINKLEPFEIRKLKPINDCIINT